MAAGIEAASADVTLAVERLAALVGRLRPFPWHDGAAAEDNVRRESARLRTAPAEVAQLRDDVLALLARPRQAGFYAECGVRSAYGFWLEIVHRLVNRVLPKAPDLASLGDALERIFPHPHDHEWLASLPDASWRELSDALGLSAAANSERPEVGAGGTALEALLEALRIVSYRLAGAALDRELLRADAALEEYESPFLAQNALLVPLLARARAGGELPSAEEVREVDVLLDQCGHSLDRVRRRAGESGISIRLTYQLARLRQLLARQRCLLLLVADSDRLGQAIGFLKILLAADKSRNGIWDFIGDNVSLVARNVTDHASRHGEHYIAEDRAAWRAMAISAGGGGVVIALMAALKIQLAQLHLPPLTEGIAYGLNYGLGFVLIHLLGFTVATKQPAMTAAAIAATVEEAHPRELQRLADLVRNVIRTQFIAVLGNVGLALPMACLLALAWPFLFAAPMAPPEKIANLLSDLHPLASPALFFAAVAGVGLFLSGLVSGYFDNQARYHQLAGRVAVAPGLRWLGPQRLQALAESIDAHYGAILGNLFFGMYLGLIGVTGALTGLPVDIRHVAFSSANLGTALVMLEQAPMLAALPWALAGVVGIALVNLLVSFSLALYVAMRSRRLGAGQMLRLGGELLHRVVRQPLSFFLPPGNRD